MTLEFNMGYYKIKILTKSCDLTNIVTDFGKFRYNRVPIGLRNSDDIFQAKVDQLLSETEQVNNYIKDIIVLGKFSLSQHTDQLRVIFYRMHFTGLKVNATRCRFRFKEIPYLGYITTWEEIKPDPKNYK